MKWDFMNTENFFFLNGDILNSFCNNVVQGKRRAGGCFCKKQCFFFLLRIVMVLDYFTGGV